LAPYPTKAAAVVALKGGGKALALAIGPPKRLTGAKAVFRLTKVRIAIRKVMKKAPGGKFKKPLKPPASGQSVKLLLHHQSVSVERTVVLFLERQASYDTYYCFINKHLQFGQFGHLSLGKQRFQPIFIYETE